MNVQAEAVAEVPETTVVGKKAASAKTGNLITDIASEVENMTKTKALNRADALATDIETNYFMLGGLLRMIRDNSWFEGFESFEAFVFERYGFMKRKTDYLIAIYTHLVTKQIPWEKVSGLGWTKLKDLAALLTLENVDEWVAKVEKLSYAEMMQVVNAAKSGGTGEAAAPAKTKDDVQTMKFKLKADQVEVVTAALAKAKGELATEFDNVALENICAGYVAGNIAVAKQATLEDLIKATEWEKVLEVFCEINPTVDITVKVQKPEGAA